MRARAGLGDDDSGGCTRTFRRPLSQTQENRPRSRALGRPVLACWVAFFCLCVPTENGRVGRILEQLFFAAIVAKLRDAVAVKNATKILLDSVDYFTIY